MAEVPTEGGLVLRLLLPEVRRPHGDGHLPGRGGLSGVRREEKVPQSNSGWSGILISGPHSSSKEVVDGPGYLLPMEPLKVGTTWKCDACEGEASGEDIKRVVEPLLGKQAPYPTGQTQMSRNFCT